MPSLINIFVKNYYYFKDQNIFKTNSPRNCAHSVRDIRNHISHLHAGEVISDEDILFYLFVIKKFIFQISVDCSNTNEIEEYLSKLNNVILKKTLDNLK